MAATLCPREPLRLLLGHGIGERADPLDLDRHRITGTEEDRRGVGKADAVRRAGEDHRAGAEHARRREKFDQRRHVEDHVVGVPILHHPAVEDGADLEGIGIGDLVARHEHRPERTEGGKRLPAAPLPSPALPLPIAGADVVCTRVAEDMLEGVFPLDVVAGLPDHNRQLAFVVDFAAVESARQDDRVAGVLHGA